MYQEEKIEGESDLRSVISLFKYGQGNYKKLFQSIFLILLATASLMVSANLMGQFAERLAKNRDDLIWIIAGILAMEAIHISLFYAGRIGLAKVTNQVALGIRKALFAKIGRLPIHYFDQQPLGRTITRLTADVEGIESFFSNTLPRLITAVITIIAVLSAMLVTDLKFGFIICLSSMPAIIFTVALRKPVRHWLRTYKKRSAALNSMLAEYINGLGVIKVFGLESWAYKEFTSKSQSLLDSAIRLMNWNSFIRPFAAMLCVMPIIVILWWGGHQVLDSTMKIGLLIAFVRYAERYFRPIMMISFELHLIQDAIASSERVKQMLEHKDEDHFLIPSGEISQDIKGKITYEDITMGYSDEKKVLHKVNFSVEAGQKVALVGKTGSGKSTTVHLLPQLYPYHDGAILIDDIPLNQWDREELRKQIGIVSQEVMIFHGSVRANLKAALPDGRHIPDEDLIAKCSLTGLDKIIEEMPEGLDTMLLDNGSNLSMGERQMIAFTRMLIRDPAILILDEATANIDQTYEKLIQTTLEKLMKNRTCFIIAHRLNTIQNCDLILVFEQGKIVERGSHDQLVDQDGYYAHLVKRQLA